MHQSRSTANANSFEGCGSWTCGRFVSTCFLNRQDVDKTGGSTGLWLGDGVTTQQRSKIKKVYRALRNRAGPEEKKYFIASKFPLDSVELTQWADDIKQFAPSLVDDFINKILSKLHPDPTEFKKKKSQQGGNVLAIEKLIRNWENGQKALGREPWTVDGGNDCIGVIPNYDS